MLDGVLPSSLSHESQAGAMCCSLLSISGSVTCDCGCESILTTYTGIIYIYSPFSKKPIMICRMM